MNVSLNTHDLLRVKSFLGQIRTRTWVILGGVVIVCLGLLMWLAISIASSLWNQVTSGGGLADNALSRAEQLLPGLREQAEQLAPGLTAEALALREHAHRFAPELTKSVEQMIPQLSLAASTLPAATPAADVSGIDVGPATRHPALVRTAFSRNGESVQADYQGKAAINSVVQHYTSEFVAAGYRHDIINATTRSELHKFTNAGSSISLSVEQLESDLLNVQIALTNY